MTAQTSQLQASRALAFLALLIAAAALGMGYLGLPQSLLPVELAGMIAILVWLVTEIFRLGWLGPLAFTVLVGAAGVGVFFDAKTMWMVVAVVSGLSAWSLGNFSRRLYAHEQIINPNKLERAYLLRLALLNAISLVLAALALQVHPHLGFVVILTLAILLIFGISRMVLHFRRLIGVVARRDHEEDEAFQDGRSA